MRRFLLDLICDDLADLAHYGSDVIASEEAIRCIVAFYQRQDRLHNVRIVHKDELQSVLMKDIETLKSSHEHHQFLIELGSRSKAHQRAPETIHYCTVDLYCVPGKKPLAFVADQYRGHKGYYTEFAKIADELGIHFAIPGGGVFQADDVHCPVFSIHHLLLTARDKVIPDLLDTIVGDTTDKLFTEFSWNELPPQYIYPSQSVSMLFAYIDYVKHKETLSGRIANPTLEESPFASFLPANLYPEPKAGRKIRNKSIKTIAAQMAGEVVVALEQASFFDEKTLIDISYQDKYPVVHQVLMKALSISEKFPLDEKGVLQAHPLFELAFSFASPMEICFKNAKFKDIFLDEGVLSLMQQGLLNPRELFNAMISIPKEILVNKEICNTVKSNLSGINIVASCLAVHKEANVENIHALLMSRYCSEFFKNPILSRLFVEGSLNINHIDKIRVFARAPEFAACVSDTERLRYLATKLSIFSVPRADMEAPEELIPDKKPAVNTGILLAESMSTGIFTTKKAKASKDTTLPVFFQPLVVLS